jgi:tRNA (guanine-N7-)-methyltransferase
MAADSSMTPSTPVRSDPVSSAVTPRDDPAPFQSEGTARNQHFWSCVFGRPAPVEIEIGAGRGAFLFTTALAAPDHNFLAIEHSYPRVAALERDAGMRGLRNVRVVRADAACIVTTVIPDASVAAYHIYFPDPWWKRRHHRRRLFTLAFVDGLFRTLEAGGRVHVATDVAEYFALMTQLLEQRFVRDRGTPSFNAPTRFAQKARQRGATIYAAGFLKRDESLGLFQHSPGRDSRATG